MSLLPKWWRRHFLHAEFVLAMLITVAVAVAVQWMSAGEYLLQALDGNRGAVYGTLATIFGSLLGFTITAASIVMGFVGSPRLRMVRESQHSDDLRRVFVASIRTLGIATIVALVGLLLDRDSTPNPWITYALLFVFFLACFRVARAVWVLEETLRLVINAPRR